MELIAKEGYNPMDYIRFYNLRNYDRISGGGPTMHNEQASGGSYGYGASQTAFDTQAPFQGYQQATQQISGSKLSASGRWDSVSECYMLNGEDIRNVPWEGPSEAEVDAFVSEELYIHSKVCCTEILLSLTNRSRS